MPNIIPIADVSAPELDVYGRLSETQLLRYYEPNGGIFIAESQKVIHRALGPGCCNPLCQRAIRVSMGTVFQIP